MISISILLELLFIGAMAGILSGWFGVGGGIIIIPALAYFFHNSSYHFLPTELIMPVSIASSLFSILLTSIGATISHQAKGSIRWPIVKKWGISLGIGVIFGSLLATHLNDIWLRYLFVIFLLFVAVKLFLGKSLPKLRLSDHYYILLPFAFFAGLASGLLGIGGGTIMVPILIALGCSMPQSAATSAASTILLAFVGSLSFILTGYMQGISIVYATGYIYWPAAILLGLMGILFAPLGMRLSYKLPAIWTQRALAILLIAIVIHLLI